ncbi:MAG: histidine kinase dimerization/phospho-acceptor domain-containing protein [bacterium]
MDKIPDGKISLKVLCLEDSPGDAELIREMLADAGYSPYFDLISTEKEYVSRLAGCGYDIILSDFMLAGFNAFASLRLAIELTPDVPFICVSGSIGEETAIELLKSGAVDYVMKERLERLPGVVIRALAEAREKKARRLAEDALREYSTRLEEMVDERTRELREAHDQLVKQEKLAVLGQLAGGVGHELRNPLGAIKNASYYLNMVIRDPAPDIKEILEVLEREIATSEKIISSLLDYARPRPPVKREVEIADLLKAVLLRNPVPPNIEVKVQAEDILPRLQADPGQLSQVLENILLNAVQAMPDGGTLLITANGNSSGQIEISTGCPKIEIE